MAVSWVQSLGTIALVVSVITIAHSEALAQQSAAHESVPSLMQPARGEVGTIEDSLAQQRGRARRRKSAAYSNVGYIDNAIIGSHIRFRYDFAHGNNKPSRAEVYYPKCGCWTAFQDPDAAGPSPSNPDPATRLLEFDLDHHEVTVDAEFQVHDRLSFFAEVPFRALRPQVIDQASGIGDIRAGFKVGLLATPDDDGAAQASGRHLTLQLRAYVPTGEASDGLGTNHWSLEPALLYHERRDRLVLEGEFRSFLPIGGGSNAGIAFVDTVAAGAFKGFFDEGTPQSGRWAGNVIRYGIGGGYQVYRGRALDFSPVVEVVGWTILSGIEEFGARGFDTADSATIKDAGGTTIVNLKLGARITTAAGHSVYLGYGEALTGEFWYERVVRFEYTYIF